MTSEQLAEYVTDFIGECQARILGVGAEQYSQGDRQKFEDMPLLDLVQYAREEAQDLAVYAVMLDIRLSRLEGALRAHPYRVERASFGESIERQDKGEKVVAVGIDHRVIGSDGLPEFEFIITEQP